MSFWSIWTFHHSPPWDFSAGSFRESNVCFFSYLKTGVTVAQLSFRWGSPSLIMDVMTILVVTRRDGSILGRATCTPSDTVHERNPAPVDREFIPLFTRFLYIPGSAGFLPSVSPHFCSFSFSVFSEVARNSIKLHLPKNHV